MPKPTPFIWFQNQAEQAAKFYVSIFKGRSKLGTILRNGEGGPGPKGQALTVAFSLDGQEIVALNGGPHYTLTPAFSFVITCKTQKEIDRYWKVLTKGGAESRCGWLVDKYGLSWQVVPKNLGKLLAHPAAMQAMMNMRKFDLRALQAAAKLRA